MEYYSHLNPGIPLTKLPSLKCHVIIGGGFPCTKHDICAPVEFPNTTCVGNSWMKLGG